MPRIVCISDTHDRLHEVRVPDGDILIHAGDFTTRGTVAQVLGFAAAMSALPHPHKIVIAGNHDFLFEREPGKARDLLAGLTYLQDSAAQVEGLRIWGAPWQPWFFDWAFNLQRGPELAAKWDLIPEGTDLLITHGPPQGILDRTSRGEAVGCADLARRIALVRPRLHVFGHIHEAWGRHAAAGTIHVNASICDLGYRAVQAPQVIDLD